MIINQISCLISIFISYLFSNGKVNKKKRNRALIIIGIANGIINTFFEFFSKSEMNNNKMFFKNLIFIIIITIIVFAIIYIYDNIETINRRKLNKKVYEFTEKANPNYALKMMAGDLSFLNHNDSYNDIIPINEQESQLKKFHKIEIIAKRPENNVEKVRFGKILIKYSPTVKFYSSPFNDIGMRFRIIMLGNDMLSTLNIYKIHTSKEYILEELNSSLTEQKFIKQNQMLIKLWDIYWSNLSCDNILINDCINEYKRSIT